jgi:hypothetical protein
MFPHMTQMLQWLLKVMPLTEYSNYYCIYFTDSVQYWKNTLDCIKELEETNRLTSAMTKASILLQSYMKTRFKLTKEKVEGTIQLPSE